MASRSRKKKQTVEAEPPATTAAGPLLAEQASPPPEPERPAAPPPEAEPVRPFAERVKPNRPAGRNIVANPQQDYRINEVPMVVIRFGSEPTEDRKGAMAAEGFQPVGDERQWAAPADEQSRLAAMRLNNEFSGQNLPYWQATGERGR